MDCPTPSRRTRFSCVDELVVGSSVGDWQETFARVGSAAEFLQTRAREVALQLAGDDEEVKSLFLDLYGFVDLPVLIVGETLPSLVIASKFVVMGEKRPRPVS